MENKPRLTNEDLTKKFKSNFDLVRYAIELAENMIKSGRDARVRSETQNRAMLVLEEIMAGKDQFDAIGEISVREVSFDLNGNILAEGNKDQQGNERRYKTRQPGFDAADAE